MCFFFCKLLSLAINALLEARNDTLGFCLEGSHGGIFVRQNILWAIFAKYIGLKANTLCALGSGADL